MSERLQQQIAFLVEIDRLKGVLRRTRLMDGSRYENSAEHSWYLAVAALVLAEYAHEPIDLFRVVKMALVHDIVEVDAGDTFVFDESARQTQHQREARAAERLFGLLPTEQAQEFRALWEEFVARETAEARFAAALDSLVSVIANAHTDGGSWRENGIPRERCAAVRPAHRTRRAHPVGVRPQLIEQTFERLATPATDAPAD
jgi:putative hydrolases of HD superfamily